MFLTKTVSTILKVVIAVLSFHQNWQADRADVEVVTAGDVRDTKHITVFYGISVVNKGKLDDNYVSHKSVPLAHH